MTALQASQASPAEGGDYNAADLRWFRLELVALRGAHGASDDAALRSTDPAVRALASRARSTQDDDIRTITDALTLDGRRESRDEVRDREAEATTAYGETADLVSLDGPDLDQRFVEILAAQARASLASSRAHMVQGLNEPGRRIAEATIRARVLELGALDRLAASHVS